MLGAFCIVGLIMLYINLMCLRYKVCFSDEAFPKSFISVCQKSSNQGELLSYMLDCELLYSLFPWSNGIICHYSKSIRQTYTLKQTTL